MEALAEVNIRFEQDDIDDEDAAKGAMPANDTPVQLTLVEPNTSRRPTMWKGQAYRSKRLGHMIIILRGCTDDTAKNFWPGSVHNCKLDFIGPDALFTSR